MSDSTDSTSSLGESTFHMGWGRGCSSSKPRKEPSQQQALTNTLSPPQPSPEVTTTVELPVLSKPLEESRAMTSIEVPVDSDSQLVILGCEVHGFTEQCKLVPSETTSVGVSFRIGNNVQRVVSVRGPASSQPRWDEVCLIFDLNDIASDDNDQQESVDRETLFIELLNCSNGDDNSEVIGTISFKIGDLKQSSKRSIKFGFNARPKVGDVDAVASENGLEPLSSESAGKPLSDKDENTSAKSTVATGAFGFNFFNLDMATQLKFECDRQLRLVADLSSTDTYNFELLIRSLECFDLAAKDQSWTGQDSSDPYVVFKLLEDIPPDMAVLSNVPKSEEPEEPQEPPKEDERLVGKKTVTITEELNPSWFDFNFRFGLNYIQYSKLSLEFWDKDLGMTDDYLGNNLIPLSDLWKRRRIGVYASPITKLNFPDDSAIKGQFCMAFKLRPANHLRIRLVIKAIDVNGLSFPQGKKKSKSKDGESKDTPAKEKKKKSKKESDDDGVPEGKKDGASDVVAVEKESASYRFEPVVTIIAGNHEFIEHGRVSIEDACAFVDADFEFAIRELDTVDEEAQLKKKKEREDEKKKKKKKKFKAGDETEVQKEGIDISQIKSPPMLSISVRDLGVTDDMVALQKKVERERQLLSDNFKAIDHDCRDIFLAKIPLHELWTKRKEGVVELERFHIGNAKGGMEDEGAWNFKKARPKLEDGCGTAVLGPIIVSYTMEIAEPEDPIDQIAVAVTVTPLAPLQGKAVFGLSGDEAPPAVASAELNPDDIDFDNLNGAHGDEFGDIDFEGLDDDKEKKVEEEPSFFTSWFGGSETKPEATKKEGDPESAEATSAPADAKPEEPSIFSSWFATGATTTAPSEAKEGEAAATTGDGATTTDKANQADAEEKKPEEASIFSSWFSSDNPDDKKADGTAPSSDASKNPSEAKSGEEDKGLLSGWFGSDSKEDGKDGKDSKTDEKKSAGWFGGGDDDKKEEKKSGFFGGNDDKKKEEPGIGDSVSKTFDSVGDSVKSSVSSIGTQFKMLSMVGGV